MPMFKDPKIEPCRCCYFTEWQQKVLKRLEDLELFSQTCRVCGYSEDWIRFTDED